MGEVLRFTPRDGSEDPSFDVSDVIGEICEALELRSFRRGVLFEVDVPPYTMLQGDREQFRTVLQLLLAQTLEVTPRGSDLVITADRDEHGVEVEVADSGTGIAHLFAPPASAFTTGLAGQKKARNALDLSRLIAALGGDIRVQDCPDGGAAITVHFPQHLQRAAA
jgi:signal transduction histidine kinase